METNIIDSYPESNIYTYSAFSNNFSGIGQTITGNGKKLIKAYFYCYKNGSPTGSAYIKVYAITGNHGSTGKPTGNALVVSEPIDVSSFGGSGALISADFIGNNQIILNAGQNYCLAIEYTESYVSNYIRVGYDSTSPTHNGNYFDYSYGNWAASATRDTIFYAIGQDESSANFFQMF